MNRSHDRITARGPAAAPRPRRLRPTPAAAALLVALAGLFAVRCSGDSLPSREPPGVGGQPGIAGSAGSYGTAGAGGVGGVGGWLGATGGWYLPPIGGRGIGGERGLGGAPGTPCDALPNPGCAHGAPGPTTDGIVCDDIGYAPDCVQGAWVCTNGMPMSQCTCYGSPYRGPFVSCVCRKTGWYCTSIGDGTGGSADAGGPGTGGNPPEDGTGGADASGPDSGLGFDGPGD